MEFRGGCAITPSQAHTRRAMIALMPRTVTSFETGNRVGLKLTDEVHQKLVNVVATTGRVSAAAGKCGLGVRTVNGWLQRGRSEPQGPFHDLAEAIARAKADFVVTAARRLNQLAVGGVIQLPAFDRDNNPIRDKSGALVVTEKAMLPNANALMYILDRVDPQPREPEDGSAQFEPRERSQEVEMAEIFGRYSLTKEALSIMASLGVDVTTLPASAAVADFEEWMRQTAIETTAAPAGPAKETEVASDDIRSPTEKVSPVTTPAEPAPAKVRDCPECAAGDCPGHRNDGQAATPTAPPKPHPIESF